MDISVHVLYSVVDDFMLKLFGQAIVGRKFIGEDCRARFDMLFDACLKFGLSAILDRHSANRSAALHHSESDSLIGHAIPIFLCAALAILVLFPPLPADESLIALNLTSEFPAEGLILHRKANPVQEKPCGLLGDPDSPVKLPRGNAVPVAGYQPHRHQPLVQAQGRIFHDGPGLQGELAAGMWLVASN